MHFNTILVFDFDGVLCNSVHDSLFTALISYRDLIPGHSLPLPRNSEKEWIYPFEREHPELFDQFLNLMPLGNFAEDYFVFLRLIETGAVKSIRSQEDFDLFKESLPKERLRSYGKLFYRNRIRMQNENPDEWVRLLPGFTDVQEAVPVLSRRFLLAIATSKDYQSVHLLLNHWGLAQYFEQRNILDKDFAGSKREHLVRFHEEHHIPFSGMHFVDDKVSHLFTVQDLGVHAYLALWGFNTPREHAIAQKSGFRLLSLADLQGLGI
jgi:phosphoglycolate phosphatase-like HAD superfamily hydrolase